MGLGWLYYKIPTANEHGICQLSGGRPFSFTTQRFWGSAPPIEQVRSSVPGINASIFPIKLGHDRQKILNHVLSLQLKRSLVKW